MDNLVVAGAVAPLMQSPHSRLSSASKQIGASSWAVASVTKVCRKHFYHQINVEPQSFQLAISAASQGRQAYAWV